MERRAFVLILFAALFTAPFAGAVFAKDTLAVLPFTGGESGEGETVAELFSFSNELNEAFAPIPRTSISLAIRNEQQFQLSAGMTDPDTIAAIGRQLGAKYVVAGNIAKLGNRNLLIISILKIDDLRQIAGDIQTYSRIEDIQDKLPEMSRNIIGATMRLDTGSLENLAVVPVEMGGDIDPRVADTLAQILSINFIRSGKYSVYPRTATLEQVQTEYRNQMTATADESMVEMGRADNPRLVLSVVARRLGSRNMFNASIINLESGIQVVGRSVNYTSLDDGIEVMGSLAEDLTGVAEPPPPPVIIPPVVIPPVVIPQTTKKPAGNPFGYGFMNLALGLGSFIQKDRTGGLTLAGGYALSLGLIIWEVSLSYDDGAAGVPGGLGLGIMGITAVYGFVRPYLFNKSRRFAGITDGVNIAVVPGERNGSAVRLSYTVRF
jgi:TolB-like protein